MIVREQEAADRIAALEAERRCIVSHATGGRTDGEGMSLNAVSVEITRFRNELADKSALEEKLRVAREGLRNAMEWHERVADFASDAAREASERGEETDEGKAMRRSNVHWDRASLIRTTLQSIGDENE